MRNVKFKIQNLIFRYNLQLEEHWWMMYRGTRMQYDPLTSSQYLNPGDFVEFFTYFNSFSLGKWKKYTNVGDIYLHLRCKGHFKLQMFGHYREGRDIKKEMYEPVIYDLKELTDIEMMVPKDSKGQVIGFQIDVLPMTPEERKKTEIAEKKGVKTPDFRFQVECGSWETVIPEEKINDVRISIATTTFKKEDYITRNIGILERELFYSDEPAKNHIRLRIIDNGRTLDPDEFNSEYIHVYPNENVGGAGGFTRGILESISAEDFKATHVLLMDDDVMVLPESFIRTYSLLALVKPQYNERYVSGAMLYFEQMNLQHEDVGYVHDDGSYGPNKRIMEMHRWDCVFENDEDVDFHADSYAGWWYCCIPVKKIDRSHLPVPLFIRGDDVEFSVANHAEFLTLNGICIWHKGFANKFNANLELYMVHRNSLIIQAMSGICKDIDFIKRIQGFFETEIRRLAYNNCDLLLDAVEEFCAGPDFMKTPQGEQIMKSHAAKNEKMRPVSMVYSKPVDFDSVYRKEKKQLTPTQKWWYQVTDNGQKLPDWFLKKDYTAVIAYDWFDDPTKEYFAEQVLAVSPFDHTAYLRKRDKQRYQQLKQRYQRVMRYYKQNRKQIEQMYQQAAGTLQSESFWREYLHMPEAKNN